MNYIVRCCKRSNPREIISHAVAFGSVDKVVQLTQCSAIHLKDKSVLHSPYKKPTLDIMFQIGAPKCYTQT